MQNHEVGSSYEPTSNPVSASIPPPYQRTLLTGADGGEGFSRFSFKPGDLAIGDRFYAKPPGLQHVLRSGADFLVRVGWNSMRLVMTDGSRPDLASIYARLAPGETSEVPVCVTGRNKGQSRKPRRLFPARLIIFRQHDAASDRAVHAANPHSHDYGRQSPPLHQLRPG